MSLLNAIPDQVIVWVAMAGLLGSFFCFLVAAGYQLSYHFPDKNSGDTNNRGNNKGSKGKIYCLKRGLILSGAGNILLSLDAVFTAITVNGGVATLSYICACGLVAFGSWLLLRGLSLKA